MTIVTKLFEYFAGRGSEFEGESLASWVPVDVCELVMGITQNTPIRR